MAKTANNAKKKAPQDIPLDNIPERNTGKKTFYPDDFKRTAAARVKAGESAESVAAELGVPTGSLISKWVRQIALGEPLNKRGGVVAASGSAATMLMNALHSAAKARDERLEAAACIIEAEGGTPEAQTMAKKIRAMKRQA